MRRSTPGKTGLLFHWFLDLIIVLLTLTVALHYLFTGRLGLRILGLERGLVLGMARLLGIRAVESGPTGFIAVGRHVITVVLVPLCSASYGASLFAGTALLLPFIRLKDRLRALLLYIPAIYLANSLRIILGVFLGITYGLRYFEYYHNSLSTIIAILVFALLWTRWFYTSTRHLHTPGWES